DEDAGREAVRHDLHAAATGEVGDLAGDRETTTTGHVRLQDVEVRLLDKPAEGCDARVGLAGRDPDRRRVGEPAVAVVVVRVERLLEPVETDVRESAQE